VQKVNEQYAAFVSSDGTSVRGKQRKKQVRKADEQAAEKLRRVGSIQDAKFRHVSVDFMKRYVLELVTAHRCFFLGKPYLKKRVVL
jgi:hypothetical protein